MNHDPLCPKMQTPINRSSLDDYYGRYNCQCELVARVREDDLHRLKEIGLKAQDEHVTNGNDWLYEPIKQFRRDVWIGFQREIATLGSKR